MKTEIRKEGIHEMSDKKNMRFALMAYDIDNDMYGELYHSDSFDEIERAVHISDIRLLYTRGKGAYPSG